MNTPALIIALDRPSLKESLVVLDRLPPAIRYVKVGLELFTAEGPEALRALRERQKQIFLDLKLHDIPNTVARAVAAAARLGVSMLTLHASGGRAMLQAAAATAKRCESQAPKLIAVTTLTSLAPSDLIDLGIQRTMTDYVMALGEMALTSGMDGLVCSVHEVEALRRRFGHAPILVTPGIRSASAEDSPASNAAGDQKRIATPAMAVKAGASFLIVGRPILDARDPQASATAILDEMEAAQAGA